MKTERYDEFFERLNRARAHGAFEDLLGSSLCRAHHALPQDPLVREMLEYRIRKVEHALQTGQLAPFLKARLPEGQLILGQDVHGGAIRILLDWLCSGLLTVANTGGGKSNLVTWIVTQIAWLACSVWLFEPYKLQTRLLLPIYQRAGKPLVILPWRNWRWNLLQCQGGSPVQHIATVVDLLVRSLNLPDRAAAILRHGIHELYQQFSVLSGTEDRYPTLFHLYEWVRARKDLNAASKDAIIDRLGAFLLALTPACAAWTRAWNYTGLMRYSIVFEMRGASEAVHNLLPSSLLFGVFQARIAKGLVNCPLELLLVFEDAQRLFNENVGTSGNIAPLDELAGIVRGAGLGLWAICQSTVGFSRRLRPNLALKIFGRLGCHEDYATLAADCALKTEQIEHIRLNLVPGTFVGQMSIGTWTHPFLFRVPLAKLPAPPTDDDVRESQRPLEALPTEFAEEFAHWTPHPVVEVTTKQDKPKPALSESDLRVLEAIVKEPGKSITHYCRKTRLNGTRMAEIRQRMVAGGFIREHSLAAKARGRTATVIEPLASAQQAVRDHQEKHT